MRPDVIKLSDIKNSLSPEKKKIDKMDLWVFLCIRPLSFYFTWFFLKLGFTSNMTTILSTVISIIGSVLLIVDDWTIQIIGAVIINLWIVLDCVDGNIARYKRQSSVFGEFLDGLSGYVFTSVLYTSMGVSVFLFENHHFDLLNDEKWLYVLIGCLTSFFTIFPRLVDHKAHTLFKDFKSENTDRKNYNKFYIIGLNVAGMAGFSNPLLLVAVLTKTLNVYLLVYFVLHTGIALYSLYKTLKSVPKNV
jgi:phosphatidylglycerophosphate synthase